MKKAAKKEKTINTTLPLYDVNGKVVGEVKLDEKLFDGKVNRTLLYEVNKMYEANKRQGTAATKTRAFVAGGGIKPWRQKGTGRARVGSIRSPLWRHGGIAYGPHPRDYEYSMPKKAMRGALISSLNARLCEDGIKPIVKIDFKEAKTKLFQKMLEALKVDGKVLVIVDKAENKTIFSARNIRNVTLMEGRNINARDVLLNEHLIIEKEAFDKLVERLK